VIHRNTTIPVSREEVVQTMRAHQTSVTIDVYQGEARRVKDNLLLGKLKVTGIPPGPAGQKVRIRFTYDLNGILEVEAFVEETAEKFQTVLAQHAEGLTPRQIEIAVAAMQALKFYPRDDAGNRHLALFAERVVGEVSPFQREDLEDAINAYESAMASGERAFFAEAREGLLLTLSKLGIVYEGRET